MFRTEDRQGVCLSCKGNGSDMLFLLLLIVSCLSQQQMPLIMHEMINFIKSGIVNLCRAESCFHYIRMSIHCSDYLPSMPHLILLISPLTGQFCDPALTPPDPWSTWVGIELKSAFACFAFSFFFFFPLFCWTSPAVCILMTRHVLPVQAPLQNSLLCLSRAHPF